MRYKIKNKEGKVVDECRFIRYALVSFYLFHKAGQEVYFEIERKEDVDEKV